MVPVLALVPDFRRRHLKADRKVETAMLQLSKGNHKRKGCGQIGKSGGHQRFNHVYSSNKAVTKNNVRDFLVPENRVLLKRKLFVEPINRRGTGICERTTLSRCPRKI